MIMVYVDTALCKLNFSLPSSVLLYLNLKDGQKAALQIKNQPFALNLPYNKKHFPKQNCWKFYKSLTSSIYFEFKYQDIITTVFRDNLARYVFKFKQRNALHSSVKLPAPYFDYIYFHLK